ncbi:MAG: glycosyltransferase family 39 protein [Tepidisphaeraceae bacterium]
MNRSDASGGQALHAGWRRWGPCTFSALLALALYAVTLGAKKYVYDDAILLGLDDRVRHPKLWGQFWTGQWINGAMDHLYRPLVSQSFALQWWLHGDRIWAYHLLNVLLHAGASALLAELGRRLANWRVGLFAGLLFACHPIHAEAVAGLVGRAELACAVGLFAAMVLFLKQPMTTPRAWAIFALGLLAMLSKEQGLLLAALLAALIPVRRNQNLLPDAPQSTPLQLRAQRQAVLLTFALVIWSAGGLILLREEILKLRFEWDRGILDVAMQPLIKSPPTDRWLIPLGLLGKYFQLLIVPARLSIDYGLAVIGSTINRNNPFVYLGAAVLTAAISAAAVCLYRRKWVALFCLLAMALTYSPASNVVLFATVFGERLMYLPSAFLLLLLAMGLTRLPRPLANVLLALLLVLGSLRTWTYVQKWNDRDAFYQYSLNLQPKSLKIHLLLADADYEKGQLSDAQRIMDDAESIYPDYWELWKMSALIEQRAGNWSQAVADWRRAFDLHRTVSVANQLGNAMGMLQKQQATTRAKD